MDVNLNEIKNKRIAAFDYGLKRVGYAVSDELHIIASPRCVFDRTKDNFWDLVTDSIKKENVGLIIVGVPYRLDGEQTDVIKAINEFIDELKFRTGLAVIPVDESFSTINATRIMIESGSKKKKRAQKGSKDIIAAALILQEFINENSI